MDKALVTIKLNGIVLKDQVIENINLEAGTAIWWYGGVKEVPVHKVMGAIWKPIV